jgi:prepilin-type N-terminal cleavage/methylation domain-containing protein
MHSFKIKNLKFKIIPKRGFTLVELLIVTALLGLLAAAAIVLIDPQGGIIRAQNNTRKQDLANLKIALEEWYNDKGCYPRANEICYDDAINICTGGAVQNRRILSQTCNICGDEDSSPSFTPYLAELPCDPKHPAYDYVYHVKDSTKERILSCSLTPDDAAAEMCPDSYRIYAKFEYPTNSDLDPESIASGCNRYGCGLLPSQVPTPTLPYGYDYGVSSPNISLEKSSDYTCVNSSGICNSCGSTYADCYQNNSVCPNKGSIYSNSISCCIVNGAQACP